MVLFNDLILRRLFVLRGLVFPQLSNHSFKNDK